MTHANTNQNNSIHLPMTLKVQGLHFEMLWFEMKCHVLRNNTDSFWTKPINWTTQYYVTDLADVLNFIKSPFDDICTDINIITVIALLIGLLQHPSNKYEGFDMNEMKVVCIWVLVCKCSQIGTGRKEKRMWLKMSGQRKLFSGGEIICCGDNIELPP